MIRIPKSASPGKTSIERMSGRNDPLAEIRRFSHELVNHLTVINLSCDKIRCSMPASTDESIAIEFERIAMSVDECVKTLEAIAQRDHADPVQRRHPQARPAAASTGNVFPLFELLEKPR